MFVPAVTMTIVQSGTPNLPKFKFSFFKEGEAILKDEVLSTGNSQEIMEISRYYISLFDQRCRADRSRDYLDLLGSSLFHIWFKKVWDLIKNGTRLVVASDVPEVLDLPWELTRLPEGYLLGSKFSIRRQASAASSLPSFSGALNPGLLRILFISCQPLDYELEDRSIIKAMEGLDLAFQLCSTGTFQEFNDRIKEFKPHFVHILALGVFKGGKCCLAFDSEDGRQDLKSSSDLGAALKDGSVQGAVIGGCQIKTPLTLRGLCRDLTSFIPIALYWNDSAADITAVKIFYADLAKGSAIDIALGHAKQEMDKLCQAQGKIYDLPAIYSGTDQDLLFDATAQKVLPFYYREEQKPLPGMTSGCCQSMVNRRRERLRLVSAIQEGASRTVIITGPEGSGKSTLATMLAFRLGLEGRFIIPIQGSKYNQLNAARFIEAGISTLDAAGFKNSSARIRDASLTIDKRLQILIEELNKGRFLLVMDQLELEAEHIKDSDLAKFYPEMLRIMDGARAIIVSPSLPAEAMTLPSRAREWPLTGLPESDFIKFILDDEAVASRYRSGKLGYHMLQELFKSINGLPSCLSQLQIALRTMEPDEIKSASEAENLCQHILSRLYSSLSPNSQKTLSQAAVFESAIDLAGLQIVTGEKGDKLVELMRGWKNLAMVCEMAKIDQTVWVIQNRDWLISKLSLDQLKAAHKAAGDYLNELAQARQSNISRLDKLMEARGHFLDAGDLDKAREVTDRISGFLELRGFYSQIILLNQELLGFKDHPLPMGWIGRAYLDQGSYDDAKEWYQRALRSGEEARSCQDLAYIYQHQGEQDLAGENFQKALEISQKAGDLDGEAAAWHGLASVDMERNRNDDARQKLLRVLEIEERIGDIRGKAATLQNIASLDLRQGRHEAALESLESSLKALSQIGDLAGEAAVLHNMASIDLDRESYDSAREKFQKALELKAKIGDKPGEADVLHNLGLIEVQKGEFGDARAKFQKALSIYQQIGNKPAEAGAFFQLGVLAVQQNKIREGLKLIVLGSVILRSIGSEEIKRVDPLIDGLASRMNFTQAQFIDVIREVTAAYRKDQGRSLVESASKGTL